MLAIQGLTASTNSPDFLIRAELTAETALAPELAMGYLQTATPGARNGTDAYLGKVADTKFSVDRGFYDTPISVAITSATPGADIRYTLDGSAPAADHGGSYANPLTITNTTMPARARRSSPVGCPAAWTPHTYVFVERRHRAIAHGPAAARVARVAAAHGTGAAIRHGSPGRHQRRLQRLDSRRAQIHPGLFPSSWSRATCLVRSASMPIRPATDREWERPRLPSNSFIPMARPVSRSTAGIRIRGGQSRMLSNPKHEFRLFFRGEYGASGAELPAVPRFAAEQLSPV